MGVEINHADTVRELRRRMGMTVEEFAELVGLTDAVVQMSEEDGPPPFAEADIEATFDVPLNSMKLLFTRPLDSFPDRLHASVGKFLASIRERLVERGVEC